jgi:hypothetical protein
MAGSQRCFCSSVPPFEDGGADDLRAGDQRPGDAERAAGQLLGDQHHVEQLVLAALGEPAVLLGIDRAKQPSSARPEMMSSGMSSSSRWTCSATGMTLSSANRRKVWRTISRSSGRWRGPASPGPGGRRDGGRQAASAGTTSRASSAAPTPRHRRRAPPAAGERRRLQEQVRAHRRLDPDAEPVAQLVGQPTAEDHCLDVQEVDRRGDPGTQGSDRRRPAGRRSARRPRPAPREHPGGRAVLAGPLHDVEQDRVAPRTGRARRPGPSPAGRRRPPRSLGARTGRWRRRGPRRCGRTRRRRPRCPRRARR